MLFPKRPDYRVLTTAWANGTTYQLSLSREFWLESIVLLINFTSGTAASVGTWTADGLLALVKRIRLSVTDASGNRKVLDTNGPALAEYWLNTVGGLPRNTARWVSTGGAAATVSMADSTAYTLALPIPIRHPQLQDPFGASTMLPLPRLSNDPILEVELGAATDVSSAAATHVFPTKGSMVAVINRRDVLVPNLPYIPSELITYDKQWNSAGGKQDFEIPTIGTATGILIQDYKGGTARTCVLGTSTTSDEVGQDWSVEFLQSVVRRVPPAAIQAENDATNAIHPATWNNFTGSYFLDFLTDYAGGDAFNVGSALDLNSLSLNGGKARLVGSSLVTSASSFSRFTIHKLFGDLKALKFI